MRDLKKHDKAAHDWIRRHNPKIWCRGFFQFFSKCESVDNNLCECFNGTIIDARYKPIIHMLEEIRLGVKDRMERRRRLIARWEGEFCPRILQRLEKNIAEHRCFCTTQSGPTTFEVRLGDNGYVVDTKAKTCTCRMWQLTGIPCSHAISGIYYIQDEPLKYIDPSLRIEKCKITYSEYMSSMNGKNLWPRDDEDPILPPSQRRMPGRPKKARRKGANEETKNSGGPSKLSRCGRDMTCTNCHQVGHNKRGCKNPTVNVPKVI